MLEAGRDLAENERGRARYPGRVHREGEDARSGDEITDPDIPGEELILKEWVIASSRCAQRLVVLLDVEFQIARLDRRDGKLMVLQEKIGRLADDGAQLRRSVIGEDEPP